jgi:hypothetical protein
MDPENNDQEINPDLQRALELFEEESPEVRPYCNTFFYCYAQVTKLLSILDSSKPIT